MATSLQFGNAAIGAEVAAPSEVDVRGPAKRSEAETKAADDELSRTEAVRRDSCIRHSGRRQGYINPIRDALRSPCR
jgi:hypothetical protein